MECSTILEQIVIPASAQEVDEQTLYAVLAQVTDKRKRRGQRYETALVLTLMLLAKMSGQSRMSGIAQWARLRIEWVRAHLPLTRESLPCGNTYHNVCDHIDLDELNQRLADFFAPAVVEEPGADESAQPLHHWVLDGKSLRGSHRPAHGQEAQSVLNLYDVEHQHVVAQRPLAGKGHERTTALALVQELDLTGVLLGSDGCCAQRRCLAHAARLVSAGASPRW
jgi:hypothetical protein